MHGTTSERFLFPYFQGNGESGVYLGLGVDGLVFHGANLGRPIFSPPQWPDGQNLTRDPSIVHVDGVFHMVWTSNWSGTVMGYANSTDLVHWSPPVRIEPFEGWDEEPTNVWAPEIDYDPARGGFFIVFSSTLPSELHDGDGSGDPHGNDHRPYITRTTDFESFSDPEVYIDPGASTIDPDQAYDDRGTPDAGDDRWVMVYKNEMGPDDGGKTLWLATRDAQMTQPWSVSPEPIAGPGSDLRPHEWTEGPAIVRDGDVWRLYWDSYGNGHYSSATSGDLETWTDVTGSLRTPVSHPRHGTPFVAPIDAVRVPMPTLAPVGGVYNGGFEEAWNGAPRNWGESVWAGSGTFSYPSDEGRDGGACVKIRTGGGDLAWSTHATVEPNTRYTLSGWIRTENVSAGSGRGVQLNIFSMDGAITEALTGTNGWTYVEVGFENDSRRDLRINCLVGGWGSSSGTAWFDDIALTPECELDLNQDGAADQLDVLEFIAGIE